MANPVHVEILKQGVEVWNVWRRNSPINPDLSGAELGGANLLEANLTRVDFLGANLTRANLTRASLTKANLSRANLFEALLGDADLLRANLTETNLGGANLSGAILDDTILKGADLTNCTLGLTVLVNVNISQVIGLETIRHISASSIGIDTIYKSRGQIPELFLRGCGVHYEFIKYMRSITPAEYYSCFISHSRKDRRFCDRLFADLQAKGVRTWYFPVNAKWGESVWGEIDQSIQTSDKLVIVCSEDSLRSGPVLRELERSLNREDKESKRLLFPICIDNYVFDEWQHERKDDLLRRVVGDFSKWRNPKAYQKAFDRLLRDLKAESNA